jgi:opacity protein-like surface antigen
MLRTLALLAVGGLIASSASAQDGVYVEGALGLSILNSTDGYYQLSPNHPFPAYQNRRMPTVTNYDLGFAAAVRAGRSWDQFRADFEVAYSRNAVSDVDFLGTDGITDTWQNDPGATGHFDALSLMGNLYLEFAQGAPIAPYLGVGAGAGYVGGSLTASNGVFVIDHVWVPAAQLIAGASMPLSDRMSLVFDYRLRGFFGVNLREEYGTPIPDIPCDAPPGGCNYGSVAAGGTGNAFDNVISIGLRGSLN